ncbi:metalloregulator ArsR/SmtB family transcription factor [Cognatiyoonia sp. IB215446]|uniref:ArsR/SmtB family transcription factor n=1 Tax=Cognatiyoonia sp. IB215446 TaxID=3097355 RepID=UPI002A1220B8|nr:metalloregulator ArsR/SmtB family transcription factor [Cognatiyoonia sp. IB215446]MDX8350131.1 metalloregulator ArsR/SmtB family transcription factor [Cognatiyoonia sp. IB215446]
MTSDESLDAAFSALAHPARRAILQRLAQGTATVNTLAEPFEMSLPAVSKHIRVLEKAGLIKREKDAQFRRCTLDVGPIAAIADWTETYRPIWDTRFDTMSKLLTELKDQSS